MSSTDEPKALSPKDLTNQLFDAAFPLVNGDPREAARQVILFLKEALVYAVTSSVGDETARRAMLKNVGESITTSGPPAP